METLTFKTEFAALPMNIQNLLRTVKANKNSKVDLTVESEVASLNSFYRTEAIASIMPSAQVDDSWVGSDGEHNSSRKHMVSRSAIAMRYSRSRSNAPKTFMVAVALPARTFAELVAHHERLNYTERFAPAIIAVMMDAIEELG